MKLHVRNRASVLALSGLAAILSAAPSHAQRAPLPHSSPAAIAAPTAAPIDAPQALELAGGIDHSQMMYDTPGDGAIWARGESYKASFGPEGARYYPALGKLAPHDMQHAFSPDSVTVGGTSLAFDSTASAVRDGNRIDFARGAFVERYDLSPLAMEQSFVFSSLPASGDLVVHIPVASEMTASATTDGIEFKNEFGTVQYSNAIAFDARGARTSAATTIDEGAITIRVGADFLAHATMPLTIDPVVGYVNFSGVRERSAGDSAWDDYQGVWMVVFEEKYSATDTDVFVQAVSPTGTLLAGAYVDVTTLAWQKPHIANVGSAHQCLVVAAVEFSFSYHTIRGRTVQPNGTILTQGTQFDISGALQGDNDYPSVGGDPNPVQGSYCVTWSRYLPANPPLFPSYSLIEWCTVGSDGAIGQSHEFPNPTNVAEGLPSISKSNDTDRWLLTWNRYDVTTVPSVYAAHISNLGALADGPFRVSPDYLGRDFVPYASTPIANTQRSAIVWTRTILATGKPVVMVAAIDGTTVLSTTNLAVLENDTDPMLGLANPIIDGDGQHFVVMYQEINFSTNPQTAESLVSDIYLSGDTFALAQGHIHVNSTPTYLSTRINSIAAQHAVGLSSRRFLTLSTMPDANGVHSVMGAFFRSTTGGVASSYCFGDGSGTACPCGNNGTSERGCANSVFSSGALLATTGTTISTLADTVTLQASSVPANATCLFYQGTATNPGVIFGDGLRCTAGTIVRLGANTATNSVATYPGPGDPSITVRGGVPIDGGLRTYQVWYRNAANFCTASTFNLTNGVAIQWAR